MMQHPIITPILLGLAVALAIVCSIGLGVMRDVYQRLHFSAPVVSISMVLIAIAVWIEDSDPQPRIKVLLIGAVLFVMNSILTHATARAARIYQAGHWPPTPDEKIVVVNRHHFAGKVPGEQKE